MIKSLLVKPVSDSRLDFSTDSQSDSISPTLSIPLDKKAPLPYTLEKFCVKTTKKIYPISVWHNLFQKEKSGLIDTLMIAAQLPFVDEVYYPTTTMNKERALIHEHCTLSTLQSIVKALAYTLHCPEKSCKCLLKKMRVNYRCN